MARSAKKTPAVIMQLRQQLALMQKALESAGLPAPAMPRTKRAEGKQPASRSKPCTSGQQAAPVVASPLLTRPAVLTSSSSVESGPAWQTVTKRKKSAKTEGPSPVAATPINVSPTATEKTASAGDALIADGWSVPAVSGLQELGADKPGVCLVSYKQAQSALKELAATTCPVAVLSPKNIDGKGVFIQVPVQSVTGKTCIRERFLLQCGVSPEPVTYKANAFKSTETDSGTALLVLTLSRKCVTKEIWECALQAPRGCPRKWLSMQCNTEAQSIWRPEHKCSASGEWLQVMVRVPSDAQDAVLRASGKDGVFVRKFFTKESDKLEHRIVWLPQDIGLEAALRQAARSEDGVGLVTNGRVFGVRVLAAKAEQLATTLLGSSAAAALQQELWEMRGVPHAWSKSRVETELRATSWSAEAVRPIAHVGRSTTWLLRATGEPAKRFIQHQDGLIVLEKAAPRQRKAAVQTSRPVGREAGRTAWPKAWATPQPQQAATSRPASSHSGPAPAATSLPSVTAPSQQRPPAAAATAPTVPDLAFVIQQALLPFQSALEALQAEVIHLKKQSAHEEGEIEEMDAAEATKHALVDPAEQRSTKSARHQR